MNKNDVKYIKTMNDFAYAVSKNCCVMTYEHFCTKYDKEYWLHSLIGAVRLCYRNCSIFDKVWNLYICSAKV